MLEVEHKAAAQKVILTEDSTGSASNSLNAWIKLATPTSNLIEHKISYLGLKFKGYTSYLHHCCNNYPSITHAC